MNISTMWIIIILITIVFAIIIYLTQNNEHQ